MGINFRETKLKGAFVIEPEKFEDERGFFARSFSRDEFSRHVSTYDFIDSAISFNLKKHTVRGMHFQNAPFQQAKLVRCTRGSIYDAIIDLRPDSVTYGQWVGEILSAENRLMLYVPEGFAHGFQTLEDNTEVFYQMSALYTPKAEGGIRWNDPFFDMSWPELGHVIINERDRNFPDFRVSQLALSEDN